MTPAADPMNSAFAQSGQTSRPVTVFWKGSRTRRWQSGHSWADSPMKISLWPAQLSVRLRTQPGGTWSNPGSAACRVLIAASRFAQGNRAWSHCVDHRCAVASLVTRLTDADAYDSRVSITRLRLRLLMLAAAAGFLAIAPHESPDPYAQSQRRTFAAEFNEAGANGAGTGQDDEVQPMMAAGVGFAARVVVDGCGGEPGRCTARATETAGSAGL